MHYFSHISNSYVCSNQLQKLVLAYLLLNNREVFEKQELPTYQAKILAEIERLNESRPKCHPIKAHWWKGLNGDWHLSLGASICNFNLYASIN